jgi:hypothetical protein
MEEVEMEASFYDIREWKKTQEEEARWKDINKDITSEIEHILFDFKHAYWNFVYVHKLDEDADDEAPVPTAKELEEIVKKFYGSRGHEKVSAGIAAINLLNNYARDLERPILE